MKFSLLVVLPLLLGACTTVVAEEASKCLDSMLGRALERIDNTGDDGRVVGGLPVSIEENPWQVALLISKEPNNRKAQFCGGVIVDKEWVLTAAHCVAPLKNGVDIAVLSGTSSLESGGVRSPVLLIYPHESFRKDSTTNCYSYDIALLKIDVKDTPLVGKEIVGFDGKTEAISGSMMRVSGWGMTEDIFVRTTKLQAGEIPLVPIGICNSLASYNKRVLPTMFCAGFTDGRTDPCKGDSGGPATLLVDGDRQLAGLVSWGEGCATPYLYGVYTDVAMFFDWIKTTTKARVNWVTKN